MSRYLERENSEHKKKKKEHYRDNISIIKGKKKKIQHLISQKKAQAQELHGSQ
jgi:hypothetical protein